MEQSGIIFNNVKTNGVSISTDQWPFILTGTQGPDEEGGIINAVDIDWNAAQLDNEEINTTGDLLNYIKNIKSNNGKSAYELYRETVKEQEAQPAIYSFESFNNAAKEVKYGEGTVKVIEMRAGGATVEVVTNSTDQSFVGQQFNVATGLATNEAIQLYTLENNPVDIWVTVELVSEAQEAVVAMTQNEWLASLKGADGAQGEKGDKGDKGDTGTFDASALEDYVEKTDLRTSENLLKVELNEDKLDEGNGYMIISNESDWNRAYNNGNGPLAKYYNDYPNEDRYNTTNNAHGTINDKVVETILEEVPENRTYQGGWVNGHITKITIIETNEVYYVQRGDTFPQPTANIEYDLYECIDNSFSDDDTIETAISENKLVKVENKKIIFAKGLGDWSETPDCQLITPGSDKDFRVHWVNDTIYSLTNTEDNSEVYYVNSIANGSHDIYTAKVTVDPNDWNTVASYALADPDKFDKVSDKVLKIKNIKWSNDCIISWNGVISSNNVMLPWVLVYFNDDVNANIEVKYNNKVVKPWGYKVFGNENGHKAWGLASLAEELKDKSLLNEYSGNYSQDLVSRMDAWEGTLETYDENNLENLNIELVKNYYVKFEDYINLLERVKVLESKLS